MKEDLRNYNLNEERSNKENEVTIKECNDKWIVYATDERASKIAGSEVVFEVENDAKAAAEYVEHIDEFA